MVVLFPALYLALYLYYLWAATKYVHSVPWSDYRIANLMVRLHVSALLNRMKAVLDHGTRSAAERL